MGEEIAIAGVKPNISACNNKVIKAVLTNIAENREIVIPKVSLVMVGYLENLPKALNNNFNKKFTIITIKAVATVKMVK